MKRTSVAVLLVLFSIFTSSVGTALASPAAPLGETFFKVRGNISLEAFVAGLEACSGEKPSWKCPIRISLEKYEGIFSSRLGFDVGTENFADWLRQNGEVRECEGVVEQFLLPKDAAFTSATWKRKCRPGEEIVYVGGRPVLSLNCGNPIVSSLPRSEGAEEVRTAEATETKMEMKEMESCNRNTVTTVTQYGFSSSFYIPGFSVGNPGVSVFGGIGYAYGGSIPVIISRTVGPPCNFNLKKE